MSPLTLGQAQWLSREFGWSLQRTIAFLRLVMCHDPLAVILEIARQEARVEAETMRLCR